MGRTVTFSIVNFAVCFVSIRAGILAAAKVPEPTRATANPSPMRRS
jgi:hypothetical protein